MSEFLHHLPWSNGAGEGHVKKEKETPRIILVPYNGSAESKMALQFAGEETKRVGGVVYPVYAIEVPRTKPLEDEMVEQAEKGDQLIAEAEEYLGNNHLDFKSGAIIQTRNAGSGIVEEAREQKVSQIVVGMKIGENGQVVEAGVADYVMKHAGCEVIVLRLPLEHPHPIF